MYVPGSAQHAQEEPFDNALKGEINRKRNTKEERDLYGMTAPPIPEILA